ncbi:MAG: hypothetical protein L3J14_01710 [Flavobacteriaceae bacterium]|nr:hypothetical protein [Flavobacteriaceae bacterium]
MKNVIKLSVMAIAIAFVGCNKTSEKKETITTPVFSEVATVASSALEDAKDLGRSVVFITGIDTGSKSYYSDAKNYFETKNNEIVETAYSLQEIILWLNVNKGKQPFSEVHIVTNNKMSQVQLETTIKGKTLSSLSIKESVEKGLLPKLDNVLKSDAKVVVHSSGLGSNTALIDSFKQVFSTNIKPSVIASENISVFGGEFTEHYLAKPYYGFYPTANSPGRVDLSKEFAVKYPNSEIDWLSAMSNKEERFQGDVYSYKFNVPVKWEIAYEEDEGMPSFLTLEDLYLFMQDNDMISSELKELNIPIEKYRWYQTVEGDTLVIKGVATVVCVLKPLMSRAYPSEYIIPNSDNLRLYNRI